MSNVYFFGYADEFKVVYDSSVPLQIDAARLWKWSNKNLMQLNLSKCNLMVFKGDASVRIGGVEVEEHLTQKNLGFMVHNFSIWNWQAEFRRGKAIKTLGFIRRNISRTDFLSYGAILWKVLKNDLRITESVQKKALKSILRYCPLGYKGRLQKLKLLPVLL